MIFDHLLVDRSPRSAALAPCCLLVCCVMLGYVACDDPGAAARRDRDARDDAATQRSAQTWVVPERPAPPVVPAAAGPHWPSLARHVDGHDFDPGVLRDTDSCAECHAEIVDEWSASPHALASMNNPFYRMAFDRFAEAHDGGPEPRHCGGCHDPAMLFDDSITATVAPDDPDAHVGVSCGVCHGITGARTDGNGSYTLTTAPIQAPREGDDVSLRRHIERASPAALRTNAMCVSCHRGFLSDASGHGAFVLGLDEWAPWRRSAFNGRSLERIDPHTEEADCVDCHMPRRDGHASHRFLGGHTTLAAVAGRPRQLDALREHLAGVASLDIVALTAPAPPGEGEPREDRAEPVREVVFDVTIANEGVGHQFPGGARDLRDTWVEVRLEDARGETLATSGVEHVDDDGSRPRRSNVHILQSLMADRDGRAQHGHQVEHFRTPVYDHTIAARKVGVARYAFTLPEGFEPTRLPLRVRARLRHRRLTESFRRASCEAARTERGRAFVEATRRLRGARIDPCREQPIVDIDSAARWLRPDVDEPAVDESGAESWRRHYLHGLALLGQVQERIDEARASFERAERLLPEDASDDERAAIELGLARVEARQTRTAAARQKFERVRELADDHPGADYGMARAYMSVWDFERAAKLLVRIAERVDDDRVWNMLARALGSLSRYDASLAAAQRGMAYEGRSATLQRVQMLAYRQLEVPAAWIERAAETWSAYRRDTDAPHIRDACSAASMRCRRERVPVHIHRLTPTGALDEDSAP